MTHSEYFRMEFFPISEGWRAGIGFAYSAPPQKHLSLISSLYLINVNSFY